ncbi:MAG: phytoene desaturase family protein [Erysipelotrichaceae bacterium]
MNYDYDVIVVGAGNGGLSAAATVSRAGLKTLVLERHNLPGGSATSFVRGRFEFESALHELCDLGTKERPGSVRKLFNEYEAKMKWHVEKNLFNLIVPGKTNVVLPTGKEAFTSKMEELVPGCRKSVEELLRLGELSAEAQRYAMSPDKNNLVMMTRYADFMRVAAATTREGFEAIGMPKKAQDILNTYWCYLGATPDNLDFLTTVQMIYKYVHLYPGQPDKKSHNLSLSLVDVIRRNGGNIWYNCEVEKILFEDDRACGVKLKNGRELYAKQIIANCSPTTVMAKMLPENVKIPEKSLKLANARKIALELETMYVGLNRSAEELGIKEYSTLIMSDTDPDDQFKKANGKDKGVFIANCLNIVIPESSPEGTCTLFFTTFGDAEFWSNVKPEDYYKVKEERMEEWIAYYEEVTGIVIKPYIEEIAFASPATFCRYLNTPNGTPYGYQVYKWDNIINRLNAMNDEQMFKGLRLTGAACENIDGYNLCYANGNIHGKKTLKAIQEGMNNGK